MPRRDATISFQRHAAAVNQQIEYARSQLQAYSGDFIAPWLLNSFDADEWILRTPHSRYSNARWSGVIRINWRCPLPDGSFLIDPANRQMLEVTKKVCFLFMASPSGQSMSKSLVISISDILSIVKWMYLHKDIYQPHKSSFSLLDGDAMRSFMTRYIVDGVAGTLNHFELFLGYLYQQIPEISWQKNLTLDLYRLPDTDVQHIIKWLKENDFYIKPNSARTKNSSYLSRKKIANILNIDHNSLSTEKVAAFLRQFEPEVLAENAELLLPSSRYSAEYPSHNTRLVSDVISSPLSASSGLSMMATWEHLFRIRHHLPNHLPSSNGVRFSQIRRSIIASASPINKTPWIPLKVALTYTNEALRIVSCYGQPLVDFYLQSAKHFSSHGLLEAPTDANQVGFIKRRDRNEWVKAHIPEELHHLNISGWTSSFVQGRTNVFANFRSRPSLTDLISVLIGAIVLLASTMKPMRLDELVLLKRNCIFFRERDGYYLSQPREKQGSHNSLDDFLRPIPRIVAKGLELLREIGDGLKSLKGESEPYALQSLMYFCGLQDTASMRCGRVDSKFLTNCIDRLCDWINLPPDSYGRRWYYRVHEGRKSFLISFFWCFKYASLGAASWMAGHKYWEDTLTYIQANFPGDELPEFEAQYAAEQLWQFEKKHPVEATNVQQLYQSVCAHFCVTQINLICENDLKEWLTEAFKSEIYLITPIIISEIKRQTSVEVAFRINQERNHAKPKQTG